MAETTEKKSSKSKSARNAKKTAAVAGPSPVVSRHLADGLVAAFLSMLDPQDLGHVARVSRKMADWSRLPQLEPTWKFWFEKHFGSEEMFLGSRHKRGNKDGDQVEEMTSLSFKERYNRMPRDKVSAFFSGLNMYAGSREVRYFDQSEEAEDDPFHPLTETQQGYIAIGKREFTLHDKGMGGMPICGSGETQRVTSSSGKPYITVKELSDAWVTMYARPLSGQQTKKLRRHMEQWERRPSYRPGVIMPWDCEISDPPVYADTLGQRRYFEGLLDDGTTRFGS